MEPTDTWMTSHKVRLTGIRGRNMYYESTKIALFTLRVESFMDCNKHINKSIKTGNSVQNSSSIIKSKIFKHHMTRVGGGP